MRRRLHALAWVGLLSGVFFASCLARRDKPFTRQTDDDAGGPDPIELDGSEPDVSPDALDNAPHAVLGVDPPHGPFAGDTLVMIRGNGFDSDARVWFGDIEVPKANVTPVDPQRIQVLTPPGASGAVDVTVQNGKAESTRASLTGGYSYDSFYATPSSGPTSGGTIITVKGDKTQWDEFTEVEIDRQPCQDLSVVSQSELLCTTAPSSAGAKVLSVITDDTREDVLDGFLYGNSDNGFRGGLSGQPLENKLTVLAFDDGEGNAIPGVTVLLGDDAATGQIAHTDKSGVATFSGELGPKATITLAMKCFQPVTFFDVPVDHLTAYLMPVLSPACFELGELPPGGGTPGFGASVSGEVVWERDGELRRQGWTNVPPPASETEKEVAYVFRLSELADRELDMSDAAGAITPESTGTAGYKFYQTTNPGNFTLYALAGIEDRSKAPYKFTAYAMGLLRGVAVKPRQTSQEVFIPIDVPLDHALSLTLDPPSPGSRGPDRVRASVAIQIQDQGFALLPNGVSEGSLPGAKDFSFVGVPPLVGTLAGTQYVLSARAVTGPGGAPPLSVIGSFSAISTSEPLDLGGFVPLPVLTAPSADLKWDMRSLTLQQSPAGQRVTLTVVHVLGGGGLYDWTIVAPGPRDTLALPNLAELAPGSQLPAGSVQIVTTLAHIDDDPEFHYGSLRYRELAPRGWNAYATDTNFRQH
jgi:hypothetical protein